VFESADGLPILISIQNDREWSVFCTRILERPELIKDPRFNNSEARATNRRETDGWSPPAFATRDVATLARQLEEAQIAFARVNEVLDVLRHPHFRQVTIGSAGGPIDLADAARQVHARSQTGVRSVAVARSAHGLPCARNFSNANFAVADAQPA
jgi:crotonobetainyl-CoA:carnitine CoA-transferase CaiB-like acyl-CoA transferase